MSEMTLSSRHRIRKAVVLTSCMIYKICHDNYGWCVYVSSIPNNLEIVAVISYIYESYYPIFMKYIMLYFRYYPRLKI